jgi:hypothetical protein
VQMCLCCQLPAFIYDQPQPEVAAPAAAVQANATAWLHMCAHAHCLHYGPAGCRAMTCVIV